MIVSNGFQSRFHDPFTNLVSGAEVERRIGNVDQFAGRYEPAVHGEVFIGMDGQLVFLNRSRAGARQIPVVVVRQVDRRRFVGRCRVLNL